MELVRHPSEHYEQLLSEGIIERDDAQMRIVRMMDDICAQIWHNTRLSVRPWRFWQSRCHIRGMYLWGGVGCGKTFLMDLFYRSLPPKTAFRVHFHRFMGQVHDQLTAFQGQKNPLKLIAAQWSKQAKVICFDEFFVSDITDAMLLAGLFQALVDNGVTFVMTSNVEPNRLYSEGLQRARFLPAIALIYEKTHVVELASSVDYRLKALRKNKLYLYPNNSDASQQMATIFADLAKDKASIEQDVELNINQRYLPVKALCDDVLWVSFEVLCLTPRSVQDYIVISSRFQTVLLSDVRELIDDRLDAVKRFIHLVDEFYDRRVKLIISADRRLTELYQGERLKFEFERTNSRLWEMQSEAYLARAHRR